MEYTTQQVYIPKLLMEHDVGAILNCDGYHFIVSLINIVNNRKTKICIFILD